MSKIEIKKLTTEELTRMREINNQELGEVNGGRTGTGCQTLQAQGALIGCLTPLASNWPSLMPNLFPELIG